MTAGNVVLCCLDTVRADGFREHAPRLRERADLTYTECRAASSWSVPSHASMFTGALPHEHGVHTYERSFAGLDRADTFLGDLPDHRAVGASANVWAGPIFGFDDLFDDFRAVSPDRRFPEGIDVGRFGQSVEATGLRKHLAFLRAALAHDHPLQSLANGAHVQVDDWLARAPLPKLTDDGAKTICREARAGALDGPEPFALFANLMDAHGPLHHVRGYDRSLHDAPNAWTSADVDWSATVDALPDADAEREVARYRGLYAAAIDYLDRVVCDFVDDLQAATDRPTTVVVTSDHGDNMGTPADDGLWGHVESSLTEGLLHVPLLVIEPDDGDGDDRPARTVTDRVSHTALPDLLVGLARGERPDITGRPVRAERVGHSGRLADVEERRGTHGDRTLRCVYDGDRKYVWDDRGGARAFALDPDRPCWQAAVEEDGAAEFDAAALDAEHFGEPIEAFAERAAAAATAREVDDATRERLAELGYV
ncbi:MAG: sulfatase-like hydrolase/transferase [Halobacteriaceae archaeon]